MGGDIAAWCAQRGLNVTLEDRELKFIEPALQRVEAAHEHIEDPVARPNRILLHRVGGQDLGIDPAGEGIQHRAAGGKDAIGLGQRGPRRARDVGEGHIAPAALHGQPQRRGDR